MHKRICKIKIKVNKNYLDIFFKLQKHNKISKMLTKMKIEKLKLIQNIKIYKSIQWYKNNSGSVLYLQAWELQLMMLTSTVMVSVSAVWLLQFLTNRFIRTFDQ